MERVHEMPHVPSSEAADIVSAVKGRMAEARLRDASLDLDSEEAKARLDEYKREIAVEEAATGKYLDEIEQELVGLEGILERGSAVPTTEAFEIAKKRWQAALDKAQALVFSGIGVAMIGALFAQEVVAGVPGVSTEAAGVGYAAIVAATTGLAFVLARMMAKDSDRWAEIGNRIRDKLTPQQQRARNRLW